LKQGDGLAPYLFNIALEYLIRQPPVQDKSTIFYRSVQLIGYANDINIMEIMKRAVSKVREELKERAKKLEPNISVEKIKVML
jgi:hypothetical protein